MMGNYHVRFLGGSGLETTPCYPVRWHEYLETSGSARSERIFGQSSVYCNRLRKRGFRHRYSGVPCLERWTRKRPVAIHITTYAFGDLPPFSYPRFASRPLDRVGAVPLRSRHTCSRYGHPEVADRWAIFSLQKSDGVRDPCFLFRYRHLPAVFHISVGGCLVDAWPGNPHQAC